ncbi:MAG: hypothetical protein NTZ27_12495 [Ignavibacteriales bacterium]|nr:hypothetical protein [Ignavibacteriales bacterium]
MNDKKVVIGIFENELYAIIATRELREAGIKANILKDGSNVTSYLLHQTEGVPLMVPDTQVEEVKKILQIKFI